MVGFLEVEFEGFPIRGFGGPEWRSKLSGVEILTFASANIVRRFLVFNLRGFPLTETTFGIGELVVIESLERRFGRFSSRHRSA